MTAAEKWWSIEATVPGFLPSRVLAGLPVRIEKTGGRLQKIGVNCFPMAMNWDPVLDPEALCAAWPASRRGELLAARQHCRRYTIFGLRNLHLYLSYVLSAHFIEVLCIDSKGFTGGGHFMRTVLWPALDTLDGSRLRKVSVKHATFEQRVWGGFSAGIGWWLEDVSFQYIQLLDDASWRPSLCVLHEKRASLRKEAK